MESVERLCFLMRPGGDKRPAGQQVVKNRSNPSDGETKNNAFDVEPGLLREIEQTGWIPIGVCVLGFSLREE
jgi:hypothetical protein